MTMTEKTMKNKPIRLAIIISCVTAIAACTPRQMTKEQTGTAIGAGTGAAIGASVSKKNRAAGALIGALIGGFIGNRIGAHLDERDLESLQQKVLDVASTGQSNRPVTWHSDHSGASAVITPTGSPRVEKKTKRIVRDAEVVLTSIPLEQAIGTRVTKSRVNMRLGPGTEHPVKLVLDRGEAFQVMGRTRNDWYLLAENGTAIGYVSGAYLALPGERGYAANQNADSESRKQQANIRQEQQARTPIQTSEANLTLTRTCRQVIVKERDPNGRVIENKVDTCAAADGSWGA